MKKSALPLFLAAVVVIAGFVGWFALSRSGRGTRAAPAPAEAAAAAPAPAPAPAELTAAAEPEIPAPDASVGAIPLAPAPSETETRAASDSGGGRRIRGQVLFPLGAPADPSLRVVALRESLAPRKVYGSGGVLAALGEGKSEGCLGTAPVDASGAFALALPTADDVWLAVDGRFLYSPQIERARAGVDALDLGCELGGCLVARVRLPKDAKITEESKVTSELGPDGENFSMAALGTAPVFNRGAKLDAEGNCELRALPVHLPHALQVRADDFADAKVPGLEFEPGVVREVEVALVEGATLRGTVRDERGAAVGDAEVIAAENGMWGFPGAELATVKSGADGAFVLEHVAPGKRKLLAKKEGALESDVQTLELRDEEQRDGLALVLGTGATIRGTVRRPDRMAAEGAEVEVSFDPEAMVGMGAFNAARGASGKAKTRRDGTFEVAGLGKGPFAVEASLEHALPEGGKEKLLAKAGHVQAGTDDLELTLAPPSVVTGRVHDVAGVAVPKFLLRATLESAAFFMPGETREQNVDDPAGAFTVRDLEAGNWKFEARADGFGPMTPVALTLPRTDETPLELVLAPAAGIAGKVVDPRGVPVAGATVTLHAASNTERIERLRGASKAPEATTADDGSFLLEPLGAGTTTIHAVHTGFAASEPAAFETRPGERVADALLTLRKGATLTGEVYAGDGKPARGVRIVAQESGSWETNMKNADGEGRFRFEQLAPGGWTITALLQESNATLEGSESEATAALMDNMRFTMVQLEDGKEEHVVLGAPPKDPVRVSGRVMHGGKPVESGLLTFIAEGMKGLEGLKIASLGADGRYETELGAPGRYVVTVQVTASGAAFQQNNVEFRETVPEVDQHRLDFELPLGGISGHVRDADGEVLAGTRVTLATDGGIESGSLLGGHYSEATTDDQGRYAFEFLHPGDYAVAAGGALFGGAFGGKAAAGRLVRTGLHVDEGKILEGVDFQLDEPGEIRGRIVDASGAPVKDASIFVRDDEGRLLDRLSMTTSTADGKFTYTGVAAGEYVVSARGKNSASVESAPVRVTKGGSAEVELVLQPGTKLVIEVVDGEGKALDARISVTDERGRDVQGMLGFAEMAGGFSEGFDSSKQRVGPLAPGTYTVVAEANGERTSKPVVLDGQPERRLKLRLR